MHDAVVIGSGLGGLTCGAFLARAGMRVLVLEKHLRPGGYADAFRRGRFVFDCGIHSVPLAPGGVMDRMLARIGVRGRIEPLAMPHMFAFRSPSMSAVLPASTDQMRAFLEERFPGQRANLRRLDEDARYFRDTVAQADYDFEQGFVERHRDFAERYHNRPFDDYIGSVVSDPGLRHTFRSMWPYTGIPAQRAATVFYFMMFTMHYLEGSYGCRGGFAALAGALCAVIAEQGGEVRTRHEVTSLRVEGSRVRAAVCADGSEYEGTVFVSNASPHLLHGRLLPEAARNRRWLRRLSNLRPSLSCVGVYLGVTPRVTELLPSSLAFWYATDDYESIYRRALEGPCGEVDHLFLLRGVEPTPDPTLLLMTFASPAGAADWHSEKMRMAERMVERAEQYAPGLRQEIRLMEVGSPLTFERYTGNAGGALYGFENTCSLYGEARMPTRTHLANLYQVGHWQRPGGGAWNVTVNGYAVAKIILAAHRAGSR